MKKSLISAFILMSMLAVAHTQAAVYKWKDDRGHVHYTQYKPTEFKSIEVGAPPPPPSITYDLNKPFADQILGASEDKKKSVPGAAAKKKESSDRKAQQCETAKNNLHVLENLARVSITDEKTGEKVRLGEDQRAIRIEEAKKNVEFFCN